MDETICQITTASAPCPAGTGEERGAGAPADGSQNSRPGKLCRVPATSLCCVTSQAGSASSGREPGGTLPCARRAALACSPGQCVRVTPCPLCAELLRQNLCKRLRSRPSLCRMQRGQNRSEGRTQGFAGDSLGHVRDRHGQLPWCHSIRLRSAGVRGAAPGHECEPSTCFAAGKMLADSARVWAAALCTAKNTLLTEASGAEGQHLYACSRRPGR